MRHKSPPRDLRKPHPETPLPSSADLTGLIVAGFGRHYTLEAPDGVRYTVHPRGKKSTCVVGDQVRWAPTSPGEGVIEALTPRRNLLFRQDEWKTKAFAANLDQLLILVAAKPVFSETQLVRALIAAQSASIKTRIVLNKTDLPEIAAARLRLQPYHQMGLDVIELSMTTQPDEALQQLRPLLQNQTTLVLGPSGTGKSTLINLFVPSAQAQVAEISEALNSGKHTTTHTRWYWLDTNESHQNDFDKTPEQDNLKQKNLKPRSAMIDSPGFQEFGLHHIDPVQLPLLMPDLRAHVQGCRFYNCRHLQEPGCAVHAALERGEISASRYRIYTELVAELSVPRYG
jgi:ribosome biogenesis GTPase / thiamine phosphate phosphatase